MTNIVEEVSRLILIILVAILLLQIVTRGNGIAWITSKFSVANSSSTGSSAISQTPVSSVAGAGGSGLPSNPNAGAGQGGGGGGVGAW